MPQPGKNTPMTKDIICAGNGPQPVLYDRMRMAIAECHLIDDCKQIAIQASAIAAYYKQIKDDESVRKFMQIKIRAWRRIGEILVSTKVEAKPDDTTAEYIRKIRASFKGNKQIEELGDNAFRQALKIMTVPHEFFEKNVENNPSIDGLVSAFAMLQRREWEATPKGQAELKEREKSAEKASRENAAMQVELERQNWLQRKEAAELEVLKQARDEALSEVGITLDRRDRDEMQQIIFLIKKSIHDILRQAAFDNRTTMQAILRSGLMMWFVANGYLVPTEDMGLPRRGRGSHGSRPSA
jgi:hypothetical protein